MSRVAAFVMALLLMPCAASTQTPASTGAQPMPVVAVPPLATPRNENTPAGDTGVLGIQVATQIATDLRQSGAAYPVGPDKVRVYSSTEAGAPNYPLWENTGAAALVTGYVQLRPDGRLTIACYVYDMKTRREVNRKGFVLSPSDWRRGAHRCADAVYQHVSGNSGYFDTRVAYVAETGTRRNQVKRIAVMDLDGHNHRYLTAGEVTVLTPRFSPDGSRLAYMSFTGGQPHIRVLDVASGNDLRLVQTPGMSFAPSYSPDGRRIAFSMASQGNTDIYVMDVEGGFPQRLTSAPGSDTSPSFSPDGRRIVFESSRSGTQQLYVMNSDGSDQRRISFGGGASASPAWSPDGDRIAFTRIAGGRFRIGVMSPSGSDERIVTDGWQDEGPSWAPNGQLLVFHRTAQGSGRASLHVVPLEGGEARRLSTPQDASDPSWSALRK